jgi:hypothetical protein
MMSRRTLLASIATAATAVPSPEDRGSTIPRPRGLVMASPGDAGRLEGLLEDLRRTWPPEAETRHAFNRAREARGDYKSALEAHWPFKDARDQANGDLAEAVLEVAGCRKPTEDEWERFGLPMAIVATDRHLFIVKATDQSEYQEHPDDWGMTELLILDL